MYNTHIHITYSRTIYIHTHTNVYKTHIHTYVLMCIILGFMHIHNNIPSTHFYLRTYYTHSHIYILCIIGMYVLYVHTAYQGGGGRFQTPVLHWRKYNK